MKTRIITAIALMAIFFGVLFLPEMLFGSFVGNVVFAGALAVVIFLMLHECYSATGASNGIRIAGFMSASLILLAGTPFVIGYNFHITAELCSLAALLVIFINMTLVVALHGRRHFKEVLSNAFLTMYITISTSCIIITRAYFGTGYMMLIFLCAWSSDTFAYFTGKFIGRHKLIPHVSPNKTVEGSIGGIVGAVIICSVYLYVLNITIGIQSPWLLIGVLVGITGGLFGQIGDLVASSIKRDTGVKDFGSIFPGHGGVMDRFDSVMFIAPVIFGILTVVLTLLEI